MTAGREEWMDLTIEGRGILGSSQETTGESAVIGETQSPDLLELGWGSREEWKQREDS